MEHRVPVIPPTGRGVWSRPVFVTTTAARIKKKAMTALRKVITPVRRVRKYSQLTVRG